MLKSSLVKFFFLLWAILWIIAFIFIPSRVDFIHGGTFGNFEGLTQKLSLFRPMVAIKDVFISLSVVCIFAFIYVSVGSIIFRFFSIDNKYQTLSISDWIASLSTSFILGHAILSFLFILLGTNHLLNTKYLLAILLTGTLIGFSSLKILNKSTLPTNIQIATMWKEINHKTIFALTVFILFLSLFYTSSRLSYDAQAIYFSDEKLTSLSGQINFYQNDSFVASSFQTAITYAALIALAGDQAARMYSWLNGLIIILLSLAIGKKLGLTQVARLLSITLILTSTAFVDLTGDGKIDLISTAAALTATYWAISNLIEQNKSTACLAGIVAGIAIVSRPFNAFLICLFIGSYYTLSLFSSKNSGERLKIIQTMPALGVGITLPIISHLVVNMLILGDPLAFMHSLQVANASNWQWTFNKDNLWIIRLLYPFALTIMNIPQSNGNISPLFIAFLPALFSTNFIIKLKTMPHLLHATAAAVITLVLWLTILFTVFEIRYVLFLWIIIYTAFAITLEETLWGKEKFFGKSTELVIVIVLMFVSIRMIYIIIDTYSPVDKNNIAHCTGHDLCAILDPINKTASTGERVFTLSAFRYYLRPDLLACSSTHKEYQLLQPLANSDLSRFWTELYKQGFKYLVFEPRYSKAHMRFDLIPSEENTPSWMELHILESRPNGYISYQIVVKNPPVEVQEICAQTSNGEWRIKDINE